MPEGEIFIERRKHKRVAKQLHVLYKILNKDEVEETIGEKIAVESFDISISGIQLLCNEKIDVEKVIRLDIYILEGEEPLTTFAEVRWCKFDEKINKYRIGMEFLVIKEEHINLIRKIVGE